MVYSVILHVPRKPGLSPEDFKHHWEKIHVPLLKQLVGHDFPLSHTRHYIERPLDSTLDRGELANSEGPNSAAAIDGVAILTFGSKEHYERFGVKLADEKKRVVYEGDLRNFVDVGAMKGMFAVSGCDDVVFDTLSTSLVNRARRRLRVGMGAWLGGGLWGVFDGGDAGVGIWKVVVTLWICLSRYTYTHDNGFSWAHFLRPCSIPQSRDVLFHDHAMDICLFSI